MKLLFLNCHTAYTFKYMLPKLNDTYILLLYVAVIVSATYGAYVKARSRRNRSPSAPNTSVLFAYYSEGAELTPIKSGKLASGLRYKSLVALNRAGEIGNPDFSAIHIIQLPFATTIHLLGIPLKTGAIHLNPAQNDGIMEKVDLEGNYSEVFNLYCEQGMQVDTRYALDPKAMVFTLDFCQNQNWEIVGNELYFVATSSMRLDPNDKTSLFEDAQQFIEEIRPAVGRLLTTKELKLLTPYGKNYRTDLKCPLCSEVMVNNEETYYVCPNGHGILLGGNQMQQLFTGKLKPHITHNNPIEHTQPITCPSCGNMMERVAYQGSALIIDSCTKCAYRWLDAGEYTSNNPLMVWKRHP